MATRRHGDDPLARTRERMPVVESLRAEFAETEPLSGLMVGVASHLEPKTGVYLEAVRDAGARVLFTASNHESTHADVVDHLAAQSGLEPFVEAEMDQTELDAARRDLLAREPELLLTDGAQLLALAYASDVPTDQLRGVAEQTTSGVHRIEAMADDGTLTVPALAVNHTPVKHRFDNVHGTGESALANLMVTTNRVTAGSTIVVAGYGYVGRGIARKARALGAETLVTEVEPRAALRAHMDGHDVVPMAEAAPRGDVFITATGSCRVLTPDHYRAMADRALVCNAGHRAVELGVDKLRELAVATEAVGEGITRFELPDGDHVDLFADGELANLAGPYAQGHPAAVMDTTFGALLLAARSLVETDRTPGVYELPDELDREVAERKLAAHGVDIDERTSLQSAYENAWRRERLLANHEE
ncbi:adenosylhomocysteinase [Halosegnis sp.]|uniref:adenosylhomocysteinase n=1 Tax=Halosegnis sp. TaxID=2864959 RepID=UPI0035D45E8C